MDGWIATERTVSFPASRACPPQRLRDVTVIDVRLFARDFEDTASKLMSKGVSLAVLEQTRDLYARRKGLVNEQSTLRASLNTLSRSIGGLMREGRRDEAEDAKKQVAAVKRTLSGLEAELKQLQEQLDNNLLTIPNLPADDAPRGTSEEHNVVLRSEGIDPATITGSFRPHWEVGEALNILDGERAAQLSGAMFTMLLGDGARLLRALVNFALDLNQESYVEVVPPSFVNTEVFTGTGHLPKFANDAYFLKEDDLWAIPTGEVPLTGFHRNEILSGDSLPRRYMTHTSCFRREAGSAGRDTRGLQRLHEFHKVELVRICRPEQSEEEFAALLADAERPLKLLGLPYRVLSLCTGDLTFASARIYDLEVWAPGTGKWLEVSSVGLFTDYQARRSSIRYRPEAGAKPRFVHTLNGSGLATPRIIAALLEHGDRGDHVVLPEVLHRYMGKSTLNALPR